jgi:DNA (cytosine-5)-methyltransferase 1
MDRHAVVYGISSYNSNAMKSDNPNSGIYEAETSKTLDLNGGNPACNQGGMAVIQGLDAYNQTSTGDVAMSIRNKAADADHIPCVCVGNGQLAQAKLSESNAIYSIGHDIRSAELTDDEITDPLTATDYKDPIKILDNKKTYQDVTGTLDCCIAKGTSNQLANSNMFVANTSVVRRLTPMECERLQGYPDHWTDIGDWVDSKGKKHKGESDSPRYKALGNSIALPFWQWMAERMVRLIKNDEPEKEPTMASLFSGIGGFELVFARAGCKPKWNSEIESYPEAVTRVHFGDDEKGIKGDYEKYL